MIANDQREVTIMAYLNKEFADFHKTIKISTESEDLREKRDLLKDDIDKYFPDECEAIGASINKSDLRYINQGSYKIHTTIKNPYGSIDLDYAVIMPLDIAEFTDPRKFKKAVYNSLSHVSARTVNIKEPCVTVSYHSYGEETLHIDFPLYAEHNDQIYLGRGKEHSENYDWEPADPEGLTQYFVDKFKDKDQLRRIVRYFKKWKQEKYHNSSNSHEMPPSIALTILACEEFVSSNENGEDYDLSSLYETLKRTKNRFIVTKDADGKIVEAILQCKLPVEPYSDVLYKMRGSKAHLILFYSRLSRAVSDLENAINLESEHEAAKYVQNVLGEEFTVPEKVAVSASAVRNRERSFG